MNSEEIKVYVVEQLARAERMIPSERSGGWYERQAELYQLWLAAEQAESLATIAHCLDTFRIVGLPVEHVGGH